MHFSDYSEPMPAAPSAESAEILMSAGFEAKELQRYDEALQAFASALAAQPSPSAIPYLVVEIGWLLKNQGRYDEAITLFSDACKLPAILCKYSLQQELINMIAYLRIIKNTLLAKGVGLVEFSQIPPTVIAEIDEAYTEWNKMENVI
ncbi:MAG: tetratricopeptide repeat protein [Sporomusaceae bacterium]|nr:tetratricopeptide repeat protein [Sporomusaceae bacterium]